MNLLRVLLRSVCGSHPSDVPPKSKISVQIEQNGNGRRSGAFLHISFKNSSICKAFGVRQRPPQGAEFVCVPCGANNSKSTGSDTVPVRVRPPAPKPTGILKYLSVLFLQKFKILHKKAQVFPCALQLFNFRSGVKVERHEVVFPVSQ